jgi:type IV pilus assembly protein PilQ
MRARLIGFIPLLVTCAASEAGTPAAVQPSVSRARPAPPLASALTPYVASSDLLPDASFREQPPALEAIVAAPPVRPAGRRITLDVRDADIQDVCRLLADVGHANIVVAGDAHGTVTVKMHDVPWDEALDAIVLSKGLSLERRGEVIIVRSR